MNIVPRMIGRGGARALAGLLLVAGFGGACREGGAGPSGPIPDDVIAELVEMGAADQDVREGLTAESFSDTALMHRMASGDSLRTARLRDIIGRYGWPNAERAGAEASGAAFLIVQHSPSQAFQVEMLPVIEELAKRNEVSGQEFALLTDRVLKGQGKPQRYGTQFDLIRDTLVLYEVEDTLGLEARRQELGLPSMADYAKLLGEVYGAPVALHRP